MGFWGVKAALCKIWEILGQNPLRNNLSKFTTFDSVFQLQHSALSQTKHFAASGKFTGSLSGRLTHPLSCLSNAFLGSKVSNLRGDLT